jgi:NAD/NADP transhydrogenase beta subunit
MLDMPILTTVGALIGCSGAALTKIMCGKQHFSDIFSIDFPCCPPDTIIHKFDVLFFLY